MDPQKAVEAQQTGAKADPPRAGPQPTATQPRAVGEPTANANARRGIERGLVTSKETLLQVQTAPMPVTGRTTFPYEGQVKDGDDQAYHYHWFGDDPMRMQHAENLGYEVVKGSDGEPMKLAGQVAMRTPYDAWAGRKQMINRSGVATQDRANRERFIDLAEQAGTDAVDKTRSTRGPFSQVASEMGPSGNRED